MLEVIEAFLCLFLELLNKVHFVHYNIIYDFHWFLKNMRICAMLL